LLALNDSVKERGPDGEIVVERVVHVDNTEKIKQMEEELEKEKE
jgi:hypothetical protein